MISIILVWIMLSGNFGKVIQARGPKGYSESESDDHIKSNVSKGPRGPKVTVTRPF